MLDTVHGAAAPPPDAATAQTRPLRLLVPTKRRSHLFLSEQETLVATELRITRHTTDRTLQQVAERIRAERGDPPLQELRRIRDGLCRPRDIAEAELWGLRIPAGENEQEFDDESAKRLGWWWVYDDQHHETREQREERYCGDDGLIDPKGFARIACRAYPTIKRMKIDTDQARRTVAHPGELDDLVNGMNLTSDEAEKFKARRLEQAHKILLKATPLPVGTDGQWDLFRIGDCFRDARKIGLIDEWYQHVRRIQTGRPPRPRTGDSSTGRRVSR